MKNLVAEFLTLCVSNTYTSLLPPSVMCSSALSDRCEAKWQEESMELDYLLAASSEFFQDHQHLLTGAAIGLGTYVAVRVAQAVRQNRRQNI